MTLMKKILTLAALAATMWLTGSCIEDPGFLVTNEQTTGNIIEGRFQTDLGLWYDVVEQTCNGSLRELDRALIVCDVLKNTSTSKELSYDIRLKQFVPVGLPDMVDSYEDERQDPVQVDMAWISGWYLNMRLVYLAAKDSDADHTYKVAVVQKPAPNQPLIIRVCHDADGEYLGAEGVDKSGLQSTIDFISIPIYDLYKDMENYNIYFEVEFPWHKTDEDGETLLPETEIGSITGKLIR